MLFQDLISATTWHIGALNLCVLQFLSLLSNVITYLLPFDDTIYNENSILSAPQSLKLQKVAFYLILLTLGICQ